MSSLREALKNLLTILGELAKLRKCECLLRHVCLSDCNNSDSTHQILENLIFEYF
jgi:hypothetical protein